MRILIVDDFAAWRDFVRSIIVEPTWSVVGEAANGAEAVKKFKDLQPDLVLLDIALPDLNGLRVARQILQVAPGTKILFLTVLDDADIAKEALASGASGYVLKSDARTDLVKGVSAALQGIQFVSSRLKMT